MKKESFKTTWRLTTAVSLAVFLTASYVRADSLPTDPWSSGDDWYYEEEDSEGASPAVPMVPMVQTNRPSSTTQQSTGPLQVQLVGPVIYGSQPYQPTYEGGEDNIWNTKMPEFTGEMTTWGDSPNAKYNAPEVNMHNILSITQHLRNMGYEIPDSFEEKVRNAPNAARVRIFDAMSALAGNEDPFSKGARMALEAFERETGLSYENLIGNSLNLLSSK